MRALIFLAACSHAAPKPVGPTLVRIVDMPKREPVACYLPDLPEPPEPLISVPEDPVINRVMVHAREFADALAWMQSVRGWSVEVKDCLRKLGADPW